MKIRNLGSALALWVGMAALLVAGCNPAQPALSPNERANPDTPGEASETQRIAGAALGKQAEVLAHGDLARNGLEQLLVVNRFANAKNGSAGAVSASAMFITRAAVLEKNNGKWAEVLRCDEHLKNPNGYLGGSPAERVTGWRLEYATDTSQGLEIRFTPADVDAGKQESDTGESASQTVVVRWNTKAKRYQSLDRSHKMYLNEAPTLETPQSILR